MSSSRVAVRVALVCLLLAMGFFVFRAIQKDNPEYYITAAQESVEDGDYDSALLYLRKMVKRFPDNKQGHLYLSRMYLQMGAQQNGPSTYSTNQPALNHLLEAGNLAPDDLNLQRQVLREQINSGRMKSAKEAALRIIESDPENSDALFALTWDAAQKQNHTRTEELLNRVLVGGKKTPHAFQTLAIAADYYTDADQPDKARDILDLIVEKAAALKPEQFSGLSERDRTTLPRIMSAAVLRTESPKTALRRFEKAVASMQNLRESGQISTNFLAIEASRLFEIARRKFMKDVDDPLDMLQWRRLDEKIDSIRQSAIDSDNADLLIYRQTAASHVARQDREGAIKVIEEGLKKARDLEEKARMAQNPKLLDQLHEPLVLDLNLIAARQLLTLRRFDEAQKYIDVLLSKETSAGWGYLLAGYGALELGELEKGLSLLQQAENRMGQMPTIRLAQVDALLRLRRWQEALALLAQIQLQKPEDITDHDAAARAATLAQPLAKAEDLHHLANVQALLATDRYLDAASHIDAIKDPAVMPRAQALAISYLWGKDRRAEAESMLAQARQKYPRNKTLLRLETRILQTTGRSAEAGRALAEAAGAQASKLSDRAMYYQWKLKNGQAAEVLRELDEEAARFADQNSKEAKSLRLFKAQTLLALRRTAEALDLAEPLCKEERLAPAAAIIVTVAGHRLGEIDRVEKALAAAQKAEPSNRVLSLLLGQHALAQNKPEEAIRHFARVLQVTSLQRRVASALMRATNMIASSRSEEEALATLNELLKDSPENTLLQTCKAQFLLQTGKRAQGLAMLDSLQERQPDNMGIVRLKAVSLLADGQATEALKQARRCLENAPDDLAAQELVARAALAANDFTTALKSAEAIYEQAPSRWDMVLFQAEIYNQMGQPQSAIDLLQRFTREHSRLAPGYTALAKTYRDDDRNRDALETLNRGCELLPQNVTLQLARLRQLALMGEVTEATSLANRLGGSNPTIQQSATIGRVLLDAKMFDEARVWLNRAAEAAIDQQRAAVEILLAELEMNQGNATDDREAFRRAATHYQNVLKTNPQHMQASNNYAWILANNLNDPEEAIRILRRATNSKPVAELDPNIIHTLSVAYRKANLVDEARKMLEESLQSKPDNALLLFELGMVFREMGDTVPATMMLKRAVELGLPAKQSQQAKIILDSAGSPR